jgi:4-amino-4-deoxy-L-arabinose transferase-like glycosyltransferase
VTSPDRIHDERIWIALILVGFAVLATIYSTITPLFEASDELWHYPMVKYVADHHFGLPVQRPGLSDDEAPWRQEGGQPPLYYMIGAAATFWINTSDLSDIRRINPHANIGEVWPDGNANMVVHNAAREGFPWSGTVLAMHIVRFLSILMGLGTVYLTYQLGRALFPQTPLIALSAAVFTAFNPMFLFVSAAINNDNLSTLLASLLLLLIVRLILHDVAPNTDHVFPLSTTQGGGQGVGPTTSFYILLGIVAGAGMLAKFQIGFMLPLVALALLIVSIRAHDWRPFVIGGAISGGLTILIAGWWYWRNYHLYGDATGINVFLDIVGRRAVPADWHQLWTERDTFTMSFWGFFGGVNVPMESGVYSLFNLIAGVSLAGLIFGLLMWLWSHARQRAPSTFSPLILARLFALIWPVIVFLSLLAWTRQTWASQGRLWFSAIAAQSIWLAAGIVAWTPSPGFARNFNLGAVCVVFIGAAITAPFATIRPAYNLDEGATWPGETLEVAGNLPACFREPDSGQDALCMVAQPLAGDLWPGDYLLFSPLLTVKNEMQRDWSIFVHLVDQDGIIEAQRDVYPGGGLIATSDSQAGDTWNNLIAVKIPEGIYTPQDLDVYIGFYDLSTGDRMSMVGTGDRIDAVHNQFFLGQIRLSTPPGSVPNPVHVQFGSDLTLLGYEISDRSLPPGAVTDVTLYWSARHALTTDYTISIQVIDPDPARLAKAAQDDRPPVQPVTDWTPGETVSETRSLTIAPDAAPGRYRLLVRVYADPAHPLRIHTEAGGQSEDFVWLSWLQVEAPATSLRFNSISRGGYD